MECEKYIRQLEKFCDEAKIVEKIYKLKDEMIAYLTDTKGNREELIERCKTLFNKTTQLMKASERRVGRKNRNHGYPSSQILREAGDKVVNLRKTLRKERIKCEKNNEKMDVLEKELMEKKKELKTAQNNAKKKQR